MNGRWLRRTLSLLLAMTFLAGCMPITARAAEVASAPLTVRSAATNGMVRVYLSSLGSPTRLDVTVSGSYTVNGNTAMALSSGDRVSIQFDPQTGLISLNRGGTVSQMGREMALRRHAANGTSGLKIAQARKSGNLYPGDLYLKAQQSGSTWRLYPIVHVYIEYYLNGVLPYEMGNGSPAEALKAQAVAARTYTLNKMNLRASSLYDVVDTTNDQVYYGNSDSTASCTAAVSATKGIVLTNGGKLTSCYYTASNGGQTESALNAWGSSGYAYLTVKDDPFDLMSSAATVRSASIYADFNAAGQKPALISLLKSKADAQLRARGLSGNITAITSVTPHTPKFKSPSRLYTKVDFAVSCQTGSGTVPLTLTCDIFTELEKALGLSINGSSNELWSVRPSGSNWLIQARRYGHGVGMSQRGAMQMASMGYTYDQILGFYYPQSVRVQYTFTHTILSPIENGGDDTIVSTEDPAEITGGSSATATVRLVSGSDRLAIRGSASPQGQILTSVMQGALVTVLSRGDTWTQVKYGEIIGYAETSALSFQGTPPTGNLSATTAISGYATVRATGTLNLRESPAAGARVVTTIPDGAVLPVFQRMSGWARVQYGAQAGYASTDFLIFADTYPGSVADPLGNTATVTIPDGSGTVNLRQTASTSGKILAKLRHGTQVTALSNDGSWCYVQANGLHGYIMTSFLTLGSTAAPPAAPEDTPLQPGETEAVVQCADPSLPLYAAASTASSIITTIPRGASVIVTQRSTPFSLVRYSGLTGYALTASLSFPGDQQQQTILGYARVTTVSGSLNMRAQPQAGSRILRTIPRNVLVGVLSYGDTWCRVLYESDIGYVMRSFLRDESHTGGDGSSTQYAVVTTPSGTLNLRAIPSRDAQVLCTIDPYTRLPVLERGATWSKVQYNGIIGYVMNQFLVFESTQPAPVPTLVPTPLPTVIPTVIPTMLPTVVPTPIPTPVPTPVPTAQPPQSTALVVTGGGTLNLRAYGSTSAPVLAQIPEYARVTVLSTGSIWSAVSWNGLNGYVLSKYLFTGDVPTGQTAIVYTVSGSLNLRESPSTGARVLTRIPRLSRVQVAQSGAVWCRVTWNGLTGYVQTSFLRFDGIATPTPTLVPTAAPTPGLPTYAAWVMTPSGSLNLREAPHQGANILLVIPRLAMVTVYQAGSQWSQVSYQGRVGYVQSRFLTTQNPFQPTPAPTSAPVAYPAWVFTPAGPLNLRETPSTDARVLLSIPRLAAVSVLRVQNGWAHVNYQGYTGYVQNHFLTTRDPNTSPEPTATPTPPPFAVAWVFTPSGTLNLRETPSTRARVLRTIPRLAQVEVLSQEGSWRRIIYEGVTGYVQAKFLTNVQPDLPTAQPTPSRAWVVTPSGSLNLRETPSTDARVLLGIPQGAEVETLRTTGSWTQVRYQGITGYVQSKFLAEIPAMNTPTAAPVTPTPVPGTPAPTTMPGEPSTPLPTTEPAPSPSPMPTAEPAPSPTPIPTAVPAPTLDPSLRPVANLFAASGDGNVSIYPGCDTSVTPLAEIPPQAKVQVLQRGDHWCLVRWNALPVEGYCQTKYLTMLPEETP